MGKLADDKPEEITLFLLMATFLLENKDETIKTPSAKPLLSLSQKNVCLESITIFQNLVFFFSTV